LEDRERDGIIEDLRWADPPIEESYEMCELINMKLKLPLRSCTTP